MVVMDLTINGVSPPHPTLLHIKLLLVMDAQAHLKIFGPNQ